MTSRHCFCVTSALPIANGRVILTGWSGSSACNRNRADDRGLMPGNMSRRGQAVDRTDHVLHRSVPRGWFLRDHPLEHRLPGAERPARHEIPEGRVERVDVHAGVRPAGRDRLLGRHEVDAADALRVRVGEPDRRLPQVDDRVGDR
jgi:hypothetical protein